MEHRAEDCIPRDLKGCTLEELIEICIVDGESVGFLRSDYVARAYIEAQEDPAQYRTHRRLVLTCNNLAYVVQQSPIKRLSDENAREQLRARALAKLTKTEQEVLGLSNKPVA